MQCGGAIGAIGVCLVNVFNSTAALPTMSAHTAVNSAAPPITSEPALAPYTLPLTDGHSMFTSAQWDALPHTEQVQLSSHDTSKVLAGLKEASYHYINDNNHTGASAEFGKHLIERGMEIAKQTGINPPTSLAKDFGYIHSQAWMNFIDRLSPR